MLRPSTPSRRTWLRLAALFSGAYLAGNSSPVVAEDKAPRSSELVPRDDGRRAPPVVTALAIEPQRGLLALGGDDHQIRIRSLASGQQLHLLAGHTDWVRGLVFAKSSQTIFSAGNDGQLLAWSASQPGPIKIDGHTHPFTSLARHPLADTIVACTWDGQVRVYGEKNWQEVRRLEGPGDDTLDVAFSPDGQWLAAAGRGRVMIWNSQSGELLADERPHRQRIRALEFSPDGKWLASAGDDRRIHLRALGSEQSGKYLSAEDCKVFALQFTSSNELIAAGSDGKLRLWNLGTAEVETIWRGHRGTVCALAWQDEQLISAGFDASVRQWSVGDRVALKVEERFRVGSQPGVPSGN